MGGVPMSPLCGLSDMLPTSIVVVQADDNQ